MVKPPLRLTLMPTTVQVELTSTARLENAIGTDLSNLDSQNVEDPNQLRAHATIDADGHATTDLNAKADTSTGSATASTVTQTQKGLVVDDNVVPSFGPDSSEVFHEDSYGEDSYGEDSSGGSSSEDTMGSSSYEDAVIYGYGVDLSGSVDSTAVANASTHSGGSATATASAENPNLGDFGGEKVGVSIDRTVSAGSLTVDGKVESDMDVDASNDTGKATATATELQVTGVLATDLISHGELDVDGSATVNRTL